MSSRALPRAPWYAAATRRLALVRIGQPKLVACIIAAGGPGLVSGVDTRTAQQVAAEVAHTTTTAAEALDHRSDAHGNQAEDDRQTHER